MTYQSVKLHITPKQQKMAIRGAKIRMTPACIGTGQLVMLHPLNYKKVINAKGGINLELSPGEIMATASHHGMLPDGGPLSGSGFFGDVWNGIKSAGKWLKDTGIASAALDVGQKLLEPVLGPQIASVGRDVVRDITGAGMQIKKRGRPSKATGLYLGKSTGAGLYL